MSEHCPKIEDEFRHGYPADCPLALPAKPAAACFRDHLIGTQKPRTLLAGGLRYLYREQVEKRMPDLMVPSANWFEGLIGYDPVRARLVHTTNQCQWQFWVRVYSDGSIYWMLGYQHVLYDACRCPISVTIAEREYLDRPKSSLLAGYMRRCSRFEHSLESFL